MTRMDAGFLVEADGVTTPEGSLHEPWTLRIRGGIVVWSGPSRAMPPGTDRAPLCRARGWLAPVFADAHAHLAAGSSNQTGADLRGVRRPADWRARLMDLDVPPGAWRRGWGWRPPEAVPMDASELDAWFPGEPVWVERADGHGVWVNAEARRRLGAPGSAAFFEEEAADALRARLPVPAMPCRIRAVAKTLEEALAWGILHIHDVCGARELALYEAWEAQGELPAEVQRWLPGPEAAAPEIAGQAAPGTTLKWFLDGTLSARTAALLEPYADAPGHHGRLRYQDAELQESLEWALDRGCTVALHAIGDAACRQVARLMGRSGVIREHARRVRLEHAVVVQEKDLEALASRGVTFSVQPSHLEQDRYFLRRRLGDRRISRAYVLAEMVSGPARVVFGSDWPVGPWNPWAGIAAAVLRDDWLGGSGQGLTLRQAWSAAVAKGTCGASSGPEHGWRPGASADFLILPEDPHRLHPTQWASRLRPRAVVRRGRLIGGEPALKRAWARLTPQRRPA